MTCGKVYHYICENLDERLDSPRCRRIRAHLETCAQCREYLASLKTTVRLFQLLPVPGLPAGVHRRVMRSIEAERTGAQPPRRMRTRTSRHR